MAKPEKKLTVYEQLKKLVGTIEGYKQDLQILEANMSTVDSAGQIAVENGAPEAAQTLEQNSGYRERHNFIRAGLEDKTTELKSKFISNKKNLEAVLKDKAVSPLLEHLVFSYEPKLGKDDEATYGEAAKLHKELAPMHAVTGKFRSEKTSKDEEEGLFAKMAGYVIKNYVKKYAKKPLFLKALVSLAGGRVEEKDGKVSVKTDKAGNPEVVSDKEMNKDFAFRRYSGIYQEKLKQFMDIVGKKLPGYVAATLPEKQVYDFYRNVVSIEEQSKPK